FRDQRGPGVPRLRRHLPRGPLLPDQHDPYPDSTASGADRRPAAPLRPLPGEVLDPPQEAAPQARRHRPRAPPPPPLERQRPGAPARHRDARPLRRIRRDPRRRPAPSPPTVLDRRQALRPDFLRQGGRILRTQALNRGHRRIRRSQSRSRAPPRPRQQPDQIPLPQVRPLGVPLSKPSWPRTTSWPRLAEGLLLVRRIEGLENQPRVGN